MTRPSSSFRKTRPLAFWWCRPNVTDPFDAIRRNSFRAPTIRNYDVSLIKRFRLREGMQLGFEANAFNMFNNVKFRAPLSTLTSAFFGRIQGTAAQFTPRQIQVGMKLTF